MELNSDEFKKRLAKLCEENWKAKSILKANNNDFSSMPDYQQEMFLKAMNIKELTVTVYPTEQAEVKGE